MVKRQKTNFTINQEEEQQRHMKDAEDEENKNSLAIFNWFRSDKGIPYEWAKDNLTDSNLEQMAAADSNERAVEEARQQLYEKFMIAALDERVADLKDLTDKIEKKIKDMDAVGRVATMLHDIYEAYDTDKRGFLDKEQFQGYIKLFFAQFGEVLTEQQAEQLFTAIDLNGDGLIQESEIIVIQDRPLSIEGSDSDEGQDLESTFIGKLIE